MILWRDVCTRRYLMSAKHEFSIRCEGQISGNGPGIEPSWRRIASRNAAAVPRYRRQYIYEKYGFQEVKLDDYEYERGDIAFEYVVPR